MKTSLASFAEGISKLGLTEVGLCRRAALVFRSGARKAGAASGVPAELMHDLSLRRRVNITRLGRQLLANRGCDPGQRDGHREAFALPASHASHTATAKLRDRPTQARSPRTSFRPHCSKITRPYLEALVIQINGTYQGGFYDACAVMCRRLLECLLLLAFERAAKGEVIRDASGEYRAIADIIGLACSNRHIKLARGGETR